MQGIDVSHWQGQIDWDKVKGAGISADEASALPSGRLLQALGTVTQGPVKVLGDALGSLASSAGRLVAGGVADVVIFDPAARWAVKPSALVSQGKHTPFAFEATGFELAGRVRMTLVAGQLAHEAEAEQTPA